MSEGGRPLTSLLLALAALVAGAPPGAAAQTGQITGTVRDPRGSPVPGVEVVVILGESAATRRAVSGDDGRYAIVDLVPGTYDVTAMWQGFRATSSAVRVSPGGSVTVDLVLEPFLMSELTVTAMLREQRLPDVPFSVSAPTADVLRSRGATDLEAIAANVPGFSVQNLGPGQSQPAIRGASAGQIFRDQPGVKEDVGVYLDDVALSLSLFTPDLDLFDISRVEVLRGPQATLFGSGSLAGTVRYISNQPQPGVTRVFGETGVRAADGGVGGNVKAGVNLPLGDRNALRIAAYRTQFEGFMDAVKPGGSTDEDVNGGSRTGFRGVVLFQPSERLTITPRVSFQRVERDGWNRIDVYNILANPYTTNRPALTLGEREQYTAIDEPFTDDFLLTDLKLQYGMGELELTSVTAHIDRDIHVVRDGGALWASFAGGTLGLPEPVYTIDNANRDDTRSTVWSQELRLGGGEDDGLRWLVGGFFSKRRRDFGQSAVAEEFTAMTGIPTQGLRASQDEIFYSDLSYDLTQFALFGEGTVPVTDRLSLTGGIRFFRFDEERDQVFDGIVANDDTGNSLVSVPGATEADGIVPRVIASYQASPAVVLNAQVSKGFRLGGINDPLNTPACTPEDRATFSGRGSWKDETVWNHELGMKATLAGGRVSLNLAAYYMDIRDLQVTVTAGSCSSRLVFNVPDARSQGLELELSATPNEHLNLAVSASLNDAEVQSTLTSTSAEGQVSVVAGIEEGNRLPSAPRFQAAAAVTYRWTVAADAWASVTGSFQHVGSRYTQIGDQAEGFGTVPLDALPYPVGGPLTQSTFTFDPLLPAYHLLNLRLGLERGRWEVAFVGMNLMDDRAHLALDTERGGLGRVGFITNPPRAIGLEASLRY